MANAIDWNRDAVAPALWAQLILEVVNCWPHKSRRASRWKARKQPTPARTAATWLLYQAGRVLIQDLIQQRGFVAEHVDGVETDSSWEVLQSVRKSSSAIGLPSFIVPSR